MGWSKPIILYLNKYESTVCYPHILAIRHPFTVGATCLLLWLNTALGEFYILLFPLNNLHTFGLLLILSKTFTKSIC